MITAFLVENSMYKSHNTSHILQIREKQTVQGRCDRKIAFIYERGSYKKIHSYPKDVLIAAVIFAAAVCQWGGNHGKAAETVSFAALEDIAEKKVAITFDDGPNPDYTEELLEGLKERNVTASFSCWGRKRKNFRTL